MNLNDILHKYLSGTLSEDEEAAFNDWILKDENRKEVLALIESEYYLEQGYSDVPAFEELLSMIKTDKAPKGKLVFLRHKWLWAASAACVIFLLGGLLAGYQLKALDDSRMPTSFNRAETDAGQIAKLTLSDGTKVLLAGNSSLSFPDQMNSNAVLYLDGEAYFDFVPASEKIQIKTNEITTITHDSRLNIRAFSKDSTVQVAVTEGSAKIKENPPTMPLIKLRAPEKDSAGTQTVSMAKLVPAVTVNANEQATYDKQTKTTGLSKFDGHQSPLLMLYPADYKNNPDGENLVTRFSNAKLRDVINKLTKSYHLKFDLHVDESSLPVFSGTFSSKENPLNILTQVCNELGLSYQIDDSIIKVYPK